MKKKKIEDVELCIGSKEELEAILSREGVVTDEWDTHKNVKTINHLWQEVLDRESILVWRKRGFKLYLIRLTKKVYVNIFCWRHGRLLYLREARQVFEDGGRRYRTAASRPSVGEKMKHKECVSGAFVRAMEEELGISKGYAVASRKKVGVKEKLSSSSYPGLRSEATTYSFYVEFSPKQYRKRYVEVQNDKKTFFEWRLVSRCSRFVRQYQKACKAFQRRKQSVRKQSVGIKNKMCPRKRYIVY